MSVIPTVPFQVQLDEGTYDFVFPEYLQVGADYYKLESVDASTEPTIRVNVLGPLSLHAEYAETEKPETPWPVSMGVALAAGAVGLIYVR